MVRPWHLGNPQPRAKKEQGERFISRPDKPETAGSLFKAELEVDCAAIIQQNLEYVGLVRQVYRSGLRADVEYPLLPGGIPTERRIGCGGGRRFIHIRSRSVDNRDQIKASDNPRCTDGYTVRVANREFCRYSCTLFPDTRPVCIDRLTNLVAYVACTHAAGNIRDAQRAEYVRDRVVG